MKKFFKKTFIFIMLSSNFNFLFSSEQKESEQIDSFGFIDFVDFQDNSDDELFDEEENKKNNEKVKSNLLNLKGNFLNSGQDDTEKKELSEKIIINLQRLLAKNQSKEIIDFVGCNFEKFIVHLKINDATHSQLKWANFRKPKND